MVGGGGSKADEAQALFSVLPCSRTVGAFKAPDLCCEVPDDRSALQLQWCQTHFISAGSYIRVPGSL